MNQIKNITNLIIYLYLIFIIKLIYISSDNIVDTEFININQFEEKVISLGLNIPVTASWQLILALLSSENCRVCIVDPPKELIESKESIQLKLLRPWLFFIHPAKNITSRVLATPRDEFVDYMRSHIEIDRFLTKNGRRSIHSTVVTKRSLLGCMFMIKKMLSAGFIQINYLNEWVKEETDKETKELDEVVKGIYQQHDPYGRPLSKLIDKRVIETREINRLCGSFILKMSKMIYIIWAVRNRTHGRKSLMYSIICGLLEST